MAYHFELDRRSLYQVIGGSVLLLLLVFVAGVVVGLRLQLPENLGAESSSAVETPASTTSPPTASPPGSAPDDSLGAMGGASGRGTSAEASVPDRGPSESRSAEVPTSRSIASSPSANEATESVDPPSQETPAITAPYTVQLGFFSERSNARARARQMRRAGHSVTVKRERRDGQTFYRVWTGAYGSFAEATQHLDSLRRYVSGAYVARTD